MPTNGSQIFLTSIFRWVHRPIAMLSQNTFIPVNPNALTIFSSNPPAAEKFSDRPVLRPKQIKIPSKPSPQRLPARHRRKSRHPLLRILRRLIHRLLVHRRRTGHWLTTRRRLKCWRYDSVMRRRGTCRSCHWHSWRHRRSAGRWSARY